MRVVLRPLASTLPLGFFALCVGSVMLSGLRLGWIGGDETPQVALILLAFVAPLQLAACLLGFAARDVGAGTTLGLFGGCWTAVGLFLCTLAVAFLALACGAALARPVLAGVLVLGAEASTS